MSEGRSCPRENPAKVATLDEARTPIGSSSHKCWSPGCSGTAPNDEDFCAACRNAARKEMSEDIEQVTLVYQGPRAAIRQFAREYARCLFKPNVYGVQLIAIGAPAKEELTSND